MKSIVGLVLGLLGSVLNLFISGFFFILFFLTLTVSDVVREGTSLASFISAFGIWSIILAIMFFLTSIFGIIFSSMINRESKVKKGGIGCFICGLVTLNIFMLIGGAMGFFASSYREDS